MEQLASSGLTGPHGPSRTSQATSVVRGVIVAPVRQAAPSSSSPGRRRFGSIRTPGPIVDDRVTAFT